MFKSNCHTHTIYCDGKNTAEEMVIKAIELGFESIGFSGHAPMFFVSEWGMKKDDIPEYIAEIRALKEKYADKIDILCGIELDADYSDIDLQDFDYTIASVHQFIVDGKDYPIDYSADVLASLVDKLFDSSWNKMAKAYYSRVVDFVLSGNFDVVGHFDLITKYNDNYAQFTENEEYRKIAIDAIDRIIDEKADILFEVNTGAMFRVGNSTPYPSKFILEHIFKRGGKITITGDSHSTDSLNFAFDKAIEYCKECGFDCAYILKSKGKEKIIL